jgi:uncharacterized membrane protein YraQ (UPF0718 family)
MEPGQDCDKDSYERSACYVDSVSMTFPQPFAEAATTAVGFFWKAGWAFVLGYAVSAMIQAFVPKDRLTPYLGVPDIRSISLATARHD